MTEFIHLHVHSDYSLKDACVSVHSLADKAEEMGMTHLALTDHGNMFGIMEFIDACKNATIEKIDENGKIKKESKKRINPVMPIVGCEVYVSPGSRFERKASDNENDYYHLVLLVKNREGYFNLVKLCSYAYTEGFYKKPRIDEELLTKYHNGLIALSACASGEIPRLIQDGRIEEAEKKALFYRELFGIDEDGSPNYYLEIQEHGIPAGELKNSNFSQAEINKEVIGISKRTGIPLVATNDVHYLNKEDSVVHDVLLCIGTDKKLKDEKRQKYYGDQFYFKSQDEMALLFSGYPEAIANTVKIARRCNADVPEIQTKQLPDFLPEFEIPAEFKTPSEYLKHLAFQGLEVRYPKELASNRTEWENIKTRAEYELGIINKMGYNGYYLIVWDFIHFAKENDIRVGPGRGSGTGSIIAYALCITDIDPLKYNLIFERFLNPDRISMPDFDIDFENERRDEVIDYITQKYGEDKVAQIITFGTLGAKAVIKDVGRVLEISINETNMIANLIPRSPDITLKLAYKTEPDLLKLKDDPKYVKLFSLAERLEGLNRHASLHAAGIVIGKNPIIELAPLYQERKDERKGKLGRIATQYSMNFLENAGLVKMDLLGLKTLDIIKHTENLIHKRGGKYSHFKIGEIPLDDRETFKMLCEGKSFAVFQFESDGMKNNLRQTKPNSIEDLTALNAMYRPGPMKDIPKFINSKNGRTDITYPHQSLEGILKETYGVFAYQEQVMQAAQIVAGFTLGEADELRRAMGKKIPEKMAKEKEKFISKSIGKGYSKKKAEEIFGIIEPFAGYGFNKSHSAAYSFLAYQTAYLKANFSAEYMAANLTNMINSSDKDKLSKCISETRKMGIVIYPPDINYSDKVFTVVDGKIFYGLSGIKGVGEGAAEEIVNIRKSGSYKNFLDFLDRVSIKTIGKKNIELLVQTGAFDNLGISRETLIGNFQQAMEFSIKKKEDKISGQSSLFDDAGDSGFAEYKFTVYPKINQTEKLNMEKQLLGFYFSGHPIDEYREIWEKTVKVNLEDYNTETEDETEIVFENNIIKNEHDELVVEDSAITESIHEKKDAPKTGNFILVGILKDIRQYANKRNENMAFAVLEDYNGEISITFFPSEWEKYESQITEDKVAILQGKIDFQADKNKYGFIVDKVINQNNLDSAITGYEEDESKIQYYKKTWAYMADLKSSQLNKMPKGSYTVIGFLKSIRHRFDVNGGEYIFASLQDFEGDIPLAIFAKPYSECKNFLKPNEIIAFKGTLDPDREKNPDKLFFKVTSIADLAQLARIASRKEASGEKPPVNNNNNKKNTDDAIQETTGIKHANEIHIKLKDGAADKKDNLYALGDFITENTGLRKVYIHVNVNGSEKIMRSSIGISFTDNSTIEKIKKLECVDDVWRA